MIIIPVIDLMDGQVVHAKQGQRGFYQPIQTSLCLGNHPLDVIEAILSLAAFKTMYIADLNALMHQGENVAIIQQIRRHFPHINFWLDAGFPLPSRAIMTPVVGSESLTPDTVPELKPLQGSFILSLDFSTQQQFMGPTCLLDNPDYWPQTIIVMSLSHVGADSGPDYERLTRWCHQYPDRHWVAAGGVRNDEDIAQLQQLGATAVLVASALHSGRLSLEPLVSQASFQNESNDEK